MSYGIIGGSVAPTQMIPFLQALQRETGCTYNSIYRGDDALTILHQLGKHSQREIANATPAQRVAWGILGTPNPPGRSTHEIFSDGVPYAGPIGRKLEWWQCGIDVDNNHVVAVINAAARRGWQLFRPYASGVEFHHLNFRAQPRSITVANAADHSTAGSIIGGTLKRDGYKGVLRYASEGRSNVNISSKEYADLKANGIPVGIVCEHTAQFLLGGFSVGAERAKASRDITRSMVMPDGVIYMAADWDCTNVGPTFPGSTGDQNMHKILGALSGAASIIGQNNVGFYGSYFGIDWLVKNAPWVKWFWQTEAWSHGLLHPKANLLQRAAMTTIAGVQCDINVILTSNWGQRTHIPVPSPTPTRPSGIFKATMTWDADKHHMTIEGVPGNVKHWGADEWFEWNVGMKGGGKNAGVWRASPKKKP
jgi:hypothetical protein